MSTSETILENFLKDIEEYRTNTLHQSIKARLDKTLKTYMASLDSQYLNSISKINKRVSNKKLVRSLVYGSQLEERLIDSDYDK